MEIKLQIEKRTTFLLVLLIALFGGLVLVRAFNSGGPASFVGHSSEEGAVPPGAVMFFNLSTCPTGYLEATAASGRTIVGMPTAGTLEGTTGTALTNLENRAVGAHGHGVSDPGHGHGVSDPSHSHGASSSVSDPGHLHTFGCISAGAGTVPVAGSAAPSATCSTAAALTGISVSTTTSGAFTGISISSSGTGISIATAGAVAGTNSPYVQYLACVKL